MVAPYSPDCATVHLATLQDAQWLVGRFLGVEWEQDVGLVVVWCWGMESMCLPWWWLGYHGKAGVRAEVHFHQVAQMRR